MQYPAKIVAGGLDVIVTGSVISYGWQTIDIYPVDTNYRVSLVFESKPNQSSLITINQIPGGQTVVTLSNFDSQSGLATSAPLHVANWMGRKMYLSLVCYYFGQGETGTRLTQFTFTSGEAVNG